MDERQQAMFDLALTIVAYTRVMRTRQKAYFSTKDRIKLQMARQSEHQVDKLLEAMASLDGTAQQQPLGMKWK